MKDSNKNRPVIVLFVTILLLLGSNFLPSGESLFGVNIKQVDMLMDIRENVSYDDIQQNSEQEMWDEDDDFFKDDPPDVPDSLGQENGNL